MIAKLNKINISKIHLRLISFDFIIVIAQLLHIFTKFFFIFSQIFCNDFFISLIFMFFFYL